MGSFLARESSPLKSDQWEAIDKAVVEAARGFLVGRRILPIFGPLGAGTELVPLDVIEGAIGAEVGFSASSTAAVATAERRFLQLPTIHKDFLIDWRELEAQEKLGLPFDVSKAAAAALACARSEDDLVFNGAKSLNIDGILTADGRHNVALGDWSVSGEAYANVVAAMETLATAGFLGPYAVVASSKLYAFLNQPYKNAHFLELDRVEKLATAGVFQSPVLPSDAAVVVCVGPENIDLVVAQDLITAYLETSNMTHRFRVFEIVAPRVKRPGAICTIRPA